MYYTDHAKDNTNKKKEQKTGKRWNVLKSKLSILLSTLGYRTMWHFGC